MIDGKLYNVEAHTDQTLGFTCPYCGEWHVTWVSEAAPHQNKDLTNVWQYRWLAPNIIEVNPSWDNSKGCGFHSTNPWQVKLAP